jgi:hypothetical protein
MKSKGENMNPSYMAVHTKTGKLFVGKSTQTGYSELKHLKSAMTYWGIKDKSGYQFVSISFDERLTPTLTLLEEK